jgi:hypothetical protein
MKIATIALLALVLAGCSDSSRPSSSPAPSPPSAKGDFRPPAMDSLSYKTPPEWVSEETSDSMRKAQYRVPDKQGKAAPALLTFFKMSAQSEETIVDYWRQKMGDAEATVTKVQGAVNPVTLVDISGTYSDGSTLENARFLGAMVDAGEQTWYLKFVGPAPTVSGWRDAFVEMLKGMRTAR